MAEIIVDFYHPIDGRILTVNLDDTITIQEAITELIASDFIPVNPHGYNLALKGGVYLKSHKTFLDANITNEALFIISK